jgi:hypothetical protein
MDLSYSEIDEIWLKDQIEYFTQIKQQEFSKFSDVANYQLLYDYRKDFFNTNFFEERMRILNN